MDKCSWGGISVRRFVLLAVMLIGCIIYSGTVFAMQFYQMEEIGGIGICQAGGGGGGMYVGKASANNGDYYRVYNKKIKISFGKGVARFGNGEDALFIHYNAYQENSKTLVYCGSEDKGNTVQINVFSDHIYKINTDSGITLYPIRFWYGPDSQWCILGRQEDGKFVKYIDTEEITERYFGVTVTKYTAPFIVYDTVRCEGDTLVIEYSSDRTSKGLKGEFRFKWDEAAKWFSVEQIVY